MFNFDIPVQRENTDSAKWHKYQGKDIIPMWVADMDFHSPPAVLEALQQRVTHGVFGYGKPDKTLFETIVTHLQKTYQWHIKEQWIVWLPGLVTGLNVFCRSVGGPGDAVLTNVPVYPPFLMAPKFSDRRLSTTRLIFSEERWHMNFDDLEKSIDANISSFILCNPHNPTGRVFTKRELLNLADIILRHKLVVCSDEIHCDLVLEPGLHHIPLASLSPEIAEQTITLMAPSKTYNIPGLSCSFAVIPNHHLRRRFKRAMAGIVPHVNVLGLTAAQAAYTRGETWLYALRDYLCGNRDFVIQAINQIKGLHMGPVEATYLAWIDVRELGIPNPSQWFEQAGVGLSDGREFDGPGYVRLNFGCPRQLLKVATDRMARAVGQVAP